MVSWHLDAVGDPKLVAMFGKSMRMVLWSVGNTCKDNKKEDKYNIKRGEREGGGR